MYSRGLVFAQFFLIALMVLLSRGIFTSWLGLCILTLGVGVGLWAILHNHLGNFNIRPEMKEGCALVMSGPYKFVRHPMYTSVLLITLAMAVGTPTVLEWGSLSLLGTVLALKANREEQLWCADNVLYENYKQRSKRFIPFIY